MNSSYRYLAIPLVLSAAFLFYGCRNSGQEEPLPEPQIVLHDEGTIELSFEGGQVEITFNILNPREDGSVQAGASDGWLSVPSYTDSSVTVEAGPNQSGVDRSASLTMSYVYDGGKAVERSVSLHQAAEVVEEEEYDVEISATYADAVYQSDSDGLMDVRMVFSDMEVRDGAVTPPGSLLYVEALFTLNEEGLPDVGEYSFNMSNAPFTLFPGQVLDFGDGAFYTMGTYLAVIDAAGVREEHLVTGSSMTVEGGKDSYDIVCLFETEDGLSVRCVWSGPLTVRNVPGAFSTLTGDYTLNLSSAVGTAKYFSDMYGTGGANWFIELKPSDGETGDGMNVDLVCEGLDFSQGVAAGTYNVAAGNAPVPGEYLRGTLSYDSLVGTVYMGDYLDGYPESYAPAVSGELEISRTQDGLYTLKFSFTDDRGHVWDGSWTGTLDLLNMRP